MQWKQMTAAVLLSSAASQVMAAELKVQIEVPAIDIAEYHRPYVAVWVENDKGRHQQDLAVWYDLEMRDNEGTKWLKDLRLWWRHSGRKLDMPVDGLSGATRPVGSHEMTFSANDPKLAQLPAGNYRLVIEAARELGGRELLKLPFQWPATAAQLQHQQGEHELGRVALELTP